MSDTSPVKVLRVVLGDQLSERISSLQGLDLDTDKVLMMEVYDETRYVKHHKQKIVFFLSAMRHFARELEDGGIQVDYVRLNDPGNTGSFTGEVERAIKRYDPEKVVVTEPGEWRVLEMMENWPEKLDRPVEVPEDDRFLCSRREFAAWAEGRKHLRMEFFYREMRRKTGWLIGPAGGLRGGPEGI